MTNYTGTTNIYNSWVEYMAEAANTSSDTFIMGLSSSSYTPNQATHTVLADITNELSGNGYARQTLAGVTSNRAAAVLTFDFTDPVFTASGGSIVARYWWVFDDTPAGDPLVAYGLIDQTPADVTTTDGNTLTIQVNASGLFTVTRS
jgi:hypothetical protein